MRLTIHVKPLSRETRLIAEQDGTFTMHVAAPPVKGRANREISKWISKKLGKPSSSVRIIAGHYSNRKVLEISDIDEAEFAGTFRIGNRTSKT